MRFIPNPYPISELLVELNNAYLIIDIDVFITEFFVQLTFGIVDLDTVCVTDTTTTYIIT